MGNKKGFPRKNKLNANQIRKKITKYFKNKYTCKIAFEVKVNSSVLDMIVLTYNKQTNKIYKMYGIEIKSDYDTYARLKTQLQDYYKVCDKVYIALESKVLDNNLPIGVGLLRIKEKKVIQETAAMDIGRFQSVTMALG